MSSETQQMPGGVSTYFAPAERAEDAEIRRLNEFVRNNPLFQAIQESIDGYLMILNRERQALAVNPQLLSDLGLQSVDCLLGKRPGEIIECVHASEGPGGCGTSRACSACGAVVAILASQNNDVPVVGECLATVKRGDYTEALEFRVRANPVPLNGELFTVLVFNDISGDKRREALERTFFHDILNTIGGLLGWSSMLQRFEGLDPKMVAGRIVDLSNRLTREVRDQRRLSQAESGALEVAMEKASVREVLELLRAVFAENEVAKDKTLDIEQLAEEETIRTDPSLLLRVLTNMTKNALEAIEPGETAQVSFERRDAPVFRVHNPGSIPPDVAMQIFQRSFSTKGESGRGIGTYSMKLFGEKYLKGKVGFETSPESGTTFSIALPAEEPEGESVI